MGKIRPGSVRDAEVPGSNPGSPTPNVLIKQMDVRGRPTPVGTDLTSGLPLTSPTRARLVSSTDQIQEPRDGGATTLPPSGVQAWGQPWHGSSRLRGGKDRPWVTLWVGICTDWGWPRS